MSRPILISLGFNLDNHLSNIRSTFHDTDFSHIGFSPEKFDTKKDVPTKSPGNLSRLLLKAFDIDDQNNEKEVPLENFYGEAALDNNKHEDEHEEGIQDLLSVEEDLREMFSRAVEKGPPEQFHDELRSLLNEYKDIFRNKLRGDPPANIRPMVIRLKPDSKPIRTKLRRYSPPQLEFMRKKLPNTRKWAWCIRTQTVHGLQRL